MNSSRLQYYLLICDKKKCDKFLALVASYGAAAISTRYAKGSARSGAFAKALGFETEENKVIISCLLPTPKALELTELLKHEHDFIGKNTGIAFGIPVEGLSV